MTSPFLKISPEHYIAENDLVFAINDGYPVTLGHSLIVTKRLVPTWFEASQEEQHAIIDLINMVKTQLDKKYFPQGYNVGFNAGVAAGQTVSHLHVHIIPRYKNDVPDPSGGVRHVIPHLGNYLKMTPDEAWLKWYQKEIQPAWRERWPDPTNVKAAFLAGAKWAGVTE